MSPLYADVLWWLWSTRRSPPSRIIRRNMLFNSVHSTVMGRSITGGVKYHDQMTSSPSLPTIGWVGALNWDWPAKTQVTYCESALQSCVHLWTVLYQDLQVCPFVWLNLLRLYIYYIILHHKWLYVAAKCVSIGKDCDLRNKPGGFAQQAQWFALEPAVTLFHEWTKPQLHHQTSHF